MPQRRSESSIQGPSPAPSSLHVFLAGHSANALSIGIQMVLVGWLAAGVLQLSAGRIAWVQAAVLLPNLVLIAAAVVTSANATILMGATLLTVILAGCSGMNLFGPPKIKEAPVIPAQALYQKALDDMDRLSAEGSAGSAGERFSV